MELTTFHGGRILELAYYSLTGKKLKEINIRKGAGLANSRGIKLALKKRAHPNGKVPKFSSSERNMVPKGSVLVVDDELGPRESLRMILKPIYNVHAVDNGQEALNFLGRERVDLVTLDLKMPGLSGIDVLREIKKIREDVEVVVITGYGTLTNAVEAFRYGAVDFIFKPFNVAEIISIVKKTVERRSFNVAIKNLLQKFKSWSLSGADGQELFSNGGSNGDPDPKMQELHRELQRSLQQLENFRLQKVAVNYLDFLKVLIYILESKEPYTSGHSERVSIYSDLIAQDLRLSPQEKEDLQIATLLHDIGKVGLSNRLLEKTDLSEKESLDIQLHPVKGVHLIEPLAFSYTIISAIRHHHERWDGTGYPDGLSGEDIPLLARIIALADSYDAMVSDRPYRQGLSLKMVHEEIEKNSGTQFDPDMAATFLKQIKKDGRFLPISPNASFH
jgi:putative two-component system response regulator